MSGSHAVNDDISDMHSVMDYAKKNRAKKKNYILDESACAAYNVKNDRDMDRTAELKNATFPERNDKVVQFKISIQKYIFVLLFIIATIFALVLFLFT